jgi:hypothetical protein
MQRSSSASTRGRGVQPLDAVQELTIRFVAVEGGEVTGELDPYRDPDCDCRAYTRFRGRDGA